MVPQGGRRSCAPGWWCPGGEEYNQTPQDSDLNPGLWTRGHRSVPSLSENTAIDERSMRGVCLCVPRWHKTSVVSPPDVWYSHPWKFKGRFATLRGFFVSHRQGGRLCRKLPKTGKFGLASP